MPSYPRKLIEVALPLREINDASAYDKMPGIGPHPKGIHHWWARLPLPTARAVIFASVVDDPSAHPEKFPTEEIQERERERLFGIIRKMMQPKLHEHPEIYAEAQAEMRKYCDGELPPLLDPFAGGGSIPLEAARLGLRAYAGDLNPVAVLLNKCYLEIVPRWMDYPPVNPEAASFWKKGSPGYRGSGGLAADVRYYGKRILVKAQQKIGHLYPPVEVTKSMVAEHPHLALYLGRKLPVIAWLWARTVPSPNPAAQGAHVPLMSTFWLSSKKGSEAYLEPIVDRSEGTWRFVVRTGTPQDREKVGMGTKFGRGARFRCLLTGEPIEGDYIKAEGKAGRMGERLVAIVADGGRGKVYLPAVPEHEEIAVRSQPLWKPEYELVEKSADQVPLYGMTTYAHLFTPRQLTALSTLSTLIREVRKEIENDALQTGLGVQEAQEYALSVVTFLALALDRCADFNNSLCGWEPIRTETKQLFSRQAVPMVWDFCEGNIFIAPRCSWYISLTRIVESLEVYGNVSSGYALSLDAARSLDFQKELQGDTPRFLVSTDPPYYDNIGYAALSDFFYVWLRRTIGELYPELFSTILVPKDGELVASPERFGGDRRKARVYFEEGFKKAFTNLREIMDPRFPLTVYYAFKQEDEESGEDEEKKGNNGRIDRTTGWETMLTALIETGFQITATWPVRSSQKQRMNAMGANALASYIVLSCRPRSHDASQTDRRSFVAELKRELPQAIRHLQQGGIAPVDFAQAVIGPGMAIYSRYSRVLEASGKPMSVRTALALINQTLTEVLSAQEDEFDNHTRWAIAWFEQCGFEEGDFGEAELLSKAKVTSLRQLEEAGMVRAQRGKVRLLRPEELEKEWDPEKDGLRTVWKMTHQMLRVYYVEKAGYEATAELLRKFGHQGELVRDLAYRLFHLAEKKGRSTDAQGYNALVLGWPEITRVAQEIGRKRETHTERLL